MEHEKLVSKTASVFAFFPFLYWDDTLNPQVTPPDTKLKPSGSYPGHELHGGRVTLSPHLRWLASCAADGKLLLRAVGALVRFASFSNLQPKTMQRN